MDTSDRDLQWDGCWNVRDLGGLATANGNRTRRRSLIRADLLGRLTPRGKQQLLDYGVRTIVDLRFADEIAEDPSAVYDDQDNAPVCINPPQQRSTPDVRARLKQARTRAKLYNLVLDNFQENQVAVLRAIAGAAPGGLVFHCHSGKDRTGMHAALLLSLAGVAEDVIAADYALTQEKLWPQYQKWVDEHGVDEDDPWLVPITEPQTMLDMLAHLRGRYGGAEAYLLQAGLTADEITRLKSRLIDADL